jgi:nucleoid DNA-binding protein
MTNNELVKELSKRLGKSQAETKQLLNIGTETLKNILDEGNSVSIPQLGTFGVSVRENRNSYDPYHKRKIILPVKRLISFRPSSVIKQELKNERVKK